MTISHLLMDLKDIRDLYVKRKVMPANLVITEKMAITPERDNAIQISYL